MKTSHKVIGASLVIGLTVWVLDAVQDFLFFYEGSFWDLLIADLPTHEWVIRSFFLASSALLGLILAGLAVKGEEREERLKIAIQQGERREAETAALNKAAQAVLRHRQFADAARAIFDCAREIIGASGGYISLANETGDQNDVVFLEAGGLPCTVDPDAPMPIRGLRADAYQEGRVIYDNDFSHSPYKAFLPEGHVALENVLFAPLSFQDRTVGLMGLGNKPGGFSDHDAALASGFAELAAIALVSKQLEEERERLLRNLEAERSFLTTVVEQMPAGVAIAEAPSGRFILGNRRLLDIWKFPALPPDVPHCLSHVQARHTDGRLYRQEELPLHRSLASGEVVLGEEIQLIRADQRMATIMVSSAPVRDDQGQVVAGVSTCLDITARKEAEEALRLNAEHLRFTFDQAPIGAAIVSLDHRYLKANAEFCRFVGYPEEELRALPFRDITHPDDLGADLRGLSRLAAGEIDHFRMDKRYIRQDGQIVWGHLSVGLVREASGTPLHFVAMVEDITARKQAEEALRQSQELFRQIGENIQEMIFVRDLEGVRLLYVNPAYERIWGRPVESLLENPRSFLEAVHPDDRERVTREYEQHCQGEIFDHEYRVVRPDGDIRWVLARIFPIRNDQGAIYRIGGVVEDITARKQAEETLRRAHDELERRVQERTQELRGTVEQLRVEIEEREKAEAQLKDSEARFRTLLQTASSYIVTLSPEGRVIEFNQEAERVTGWKHQELQGKPGFDLFLSEENRARAQEEMGKLVAGEIIRGFELPIRLKDGRERVYLWNANVIRGLGAEPLEIIAVGQDITERQQAAAALAAERQRFFSLLEELPAYICLAAPDKSVKFANRCFREQFGDPEGRSCFEMMHGCGELCQDCPTFQVLETQTPLEWEWTRADGITFQIYDYPFADIDGSPLVLEMGIDITARKKAEEALATERRRLFSLFDQLPAFVYLIAPDYSVPFANARFRELFGEPEGRTCHTLIRGLEEPCPACPAATTLQNGKPSEVEWNLPNGRVYRIYGYPFGDVDGSPLVLKMGVDITAHKQTEQALREQSRILEAFFEHTINPLVFLDREFNFLRVNNAYAQASHRELSEFLGRNHFDLYPGEESRAIFTQVVETKTPYQAVAKPLGFPDHPEWGSTYWDWILAPILDEAGEVDFLAFSLNDVTQRILAEEKKAQLHEIIEATPDLVGTADSSGRVFYLNQAGRRMLGLGRDEELTRYTIADFHPEEAREIIYAQALPVSQREGAWQGEVKLRSLDGREIPVSQVILAHRTPAGAVKFYSTIVRDISDLKQAEEKLRLLTAQLLRAQEDERRRLSRELHDELGQSLMVLKMQTRTIERKLPKGQKALREDCRRALQYIDEIIDNARRLSNDLSPSILEDLGLSAALHYLFEEFRRHHADLHFMVEQEPLDQYISREAQVNIFRIFQESLTNIAKYAQASQVKVSLQKQGDLLAGVVEDDGIGFAVSEVAARRGYERGLGLAAMDERVRIMGGALHISSDRGKGTKIAFHIPLSKDGVRTPEA